MRILLVGGTGLLGSAIHARPSEGHECVSVPRHPTAAQDTHLTTLDPRLGYSCRCRRRHECGWRHSGAGHARRSCHRKRGALYAADVRRVILSSATGADRDARSDFSRTKHQG